MLALVVRRLAVGVLIVWLASVLVFLATQLLPGDAARELLGRESTPQALELLRKQLHLDDPALVQYGRWLKDMVTAHWGQSLTSQSSVAHIVLTGAENTGLVMLFTTLIATPIALFFGVLGALKSEGYVDHALTVVTLVLVALPSFVIAVALIFLLGDVRVPHPAGGVADQPDAVGLRAAEAPDPAGGDARSRRRPLSAPDDPGEHGRGAAERLRHARAAPRALAPARRLPPRSAECRRDDDPGDGAQPVFLAGGVSWWRRSSPIQGSATRS